MNSYFVQLYSKILPIPCRLCGVDCKQHALCDACIRDLPLLGPTCPRCSMPTTHAQLCGRCLNNPPEHDLSFSLFPYRNPIKRLISDYKYHDKLHLSLLFSQLMFDQLKARSLPHCLIPIPLHSTRLRERGYNQSLELAKCLGKQLNIPVNNDYLHRIINTPPQSTLPFNGRKNNLRHAFSLNSATPPKHIALIDDVLTTGHTANAAAKLFRNKGVKTIEVWTIARTIGHY